MSNNLENITVCVMGLGYVGLPTAGILAGKGYQVLGVDTSPGVVRKINSGAIHIHEPGLREIIRDCVATGRLRARLKPAPAHVFIIAVPTPINPDKSPDISFVENAVAMIAPHLRADSLVLLESTSPVGTTERAASLLRRARTDLEIPEYTRAPAADSRNAGVSLCYCPERVLPGNVFAEFVNNDRIVGGLDPRAAQRARVFYRTVVRGNIFTTDCRTAEMAKLAENTFRDINIAYANELSVLTRKHGIDAHEVISLANQHPRVNILTPGPGVGGHCIPVDPWFLAHGAGTSARFIRAARNRNDAMPGIVADEIRALCRGVKNPVIALLGLAYKADTDDLRESPAVKVAALLARNSAHTILCVEPFVKTLPPALSGLNNVRLAASLPRALAAAHAAAVLTAHSQFRDMDPGLLKSKLAVLDVTGMLRRAQ